MESKCIFCAVLDRESEGSFVATRSHVVAFLDILPVAEGHTLIVPRRHVVGLADLDDTEGAEMFQLARHVAAAQRRLGLAEGINLFLADGAVAGQEVFHVHLHVLARQSTDGMRVEVDYPPPPNRSELDATAQRLRTALAL